MTLLRIRMKRDVSLRTQFLVLFIALITLTLFIFGFRYYSISTSVVTDVAEKNTYQIIKKSNETIDTKLSMLLQNIVAFSNDKELYDAYSSIDPQSDENILKGDRVISNIIQKYFSHFHDIYSVQLATSYFTYGPTTFYSGQYGKGYIPANAFAKSRLSEAAAAQKGKILWYPTYSFVDMFNVPALRDVQIDYKHLFTAMEMLDGALTEDSVYHPLPEGVEAPVLLVNFKEEFFHSMLGQSVPYSDSVFFVLTSDGYVVSGPDESAVSTRMTESWAGHILQAKSGIDSVMIDGKRMIVCFDTSKVTGWTSVIAFPSEQLVGQIIYAMRSYFIYSALIIAFLAGITSYLISGRITGPIRKLTRAVKLTGKGDFDVKLADTGASSEFRILIRSFNQMNERIGKLIDENYEIKIRERDAEITALNLQLNPHFMYNTLNLINLLAMENGQDEISDMIVSLSRMMKYSVKNNKELVSFREDYAYLEAYIFLMSKRFEGKIHIETHVDPELLDTTVPKFLLQPFVENAFVHGFSSAVSGGCLFISAKISGGTRTFTVQDNGKGMTAQRISEITDDSADSLGMNNVSKRIDILYGAPYGIALESMPGQGTTVTVTLPM